MEFIFGVLVIAALVAVWYIWTSNSLKQMKVKIAEALSGIDVALTKRYDALTKLLDITKAYAKHEQETLAQVVQMRSGMTMKDRMEASASMDKAMGQINVLAEQYPELRSSDNFRQLQVSVMDVEEHLQAARRAYNGNVSAYNQAIVAFPKSIVANNLGMQREAFFEASQQAKGDVKMEF